MIARSPTFLQKYQLIHHNGIPCNLSGGSSSAVQLAISLKTQETVAIKKINRKIALTQVSIQMKLNHPHIIKILDYFFDECNQTTFIVLQYAEKGSLYDYILDHGPLDRNLLQKIFVQTCEAIRYIHSQKIMHRDIKPQNILLTKNFIVKICDFGFATQETQSNLFCGTPEYMAPQMLLKKTYDYRIDIWSLGILLFELIEGKVPFQGNNEEDVLKEMKQSAYFSDKFSVEEIQIIQKILKSQATERPSIPQILDHPLFNARYMSPEMKSERSTVQSWKKEESPRKIRMISSRGFAIRKKQNPRQMNKIQAFNRAELAEEMIFPIENQIQMPTQIHENQKYSPVKRQKFSLKTVLTRKASCL